MLKGYKLFSIFKMKCPKCHEGHFFEGSIFNFSTMGKVKEKCPKCGLKYEIETGFYQGSYYVSYALGVALFVVVVALNYIFKDEVSPESLFISYLIALLILFPVIYALSKIIWANFFIKYQKPNDKRD